MSDIVYFAAWRLVWTLGARWTPPPFHPWRRWLLRLFGADIAPKARVYGSAWISDPRHLKMGRHSVIGFHTRIHSDGEVVLEDRAIVSQYNLVETLRWDMVGEALRPVATTVRFCRCCWIASYCYVGPGVTIGEGAVLGGGGVAHESLTPWTIFVGNPAVRKRSRLQHASADGDTP